MLICLSTRRHALIPGTLEHTDRLTYSRDLHHTVYDLIFTWSERNTIETAIRRSAEVSGARRVKFVISWLSDFPLQLQIKRASSLPCNIAPYFHATYVCRFSGCRMTLRRWGSFTSNECWIAIGWDGCNPIVLDVTLQDHRSSRPLLLPLL